MADLVPAGTGLDLTDVDPEMAPAVVQHYTEAGPVPGTAAAVERHCTVAVHSAVVLHYTEDAVCSAVVRRQRNCAL